MANVSKVAGSFGRLWGKGRESFLPEVRRILSVSGNQATSYLQGLVTSDLTQPPVHPRPESEGYASPGVPKRYQRKEDDPVVEFNNNLRATCFLDNKGRVVTDSLLWKVDDEHYYIDCPGSSADALLKHLRQYKLRRTKVEIEDASQKMTSHVVFGTLASQGAPPGYLVGMDPRHPSLGMRVIKLAKEGETIEEQQNQFAKLMNNVFPESHGNYELVRRLAGVAEGKELAGRVALETNQEFLNAVSFHKGCYLGQELTARVHYTGAVRKRIMPLLLIDAHTEVPQSWSVASSFQQGRSLNKFTKKELKTLPARLPRLSVLTAGNLVAITTGSVEPEGDAIDQAAALELQKVQERATTLLNRIEISCQSGADIVDCSDEKKIGQIISPPVKGTNVVLALMKLDAVGMMSNGVWSRTNKVTIGDSEEVFRYLPYLPLWWPDIDPETGKAKEVDGDENDDNDEEEEVFQKKEAKVEFETGQLSEEKKTE